MAESKSESEKAQRDYWMSWQKKSKHIFTSVVVVFDYPVTSPWLIPRKKLLETAFADTKKSC